MKIRVGLGLGTFGADLDGDTFWTIVDTCEHGGWDSIWFSERVGGPGPDPLAAMAATAGRTRRLKFGMSVLVVPGRNPVLLAKELATIDALSGGRLIPAFGLGVESASERAIFGVDRSESAARTDEAVALMKRLWSEENVEHHGRFFSVDRLTLRPRPVQKPHPDVWFGGISPPALRRVGRLGEGWLPSFIAVEEYKPKADAVREAAAAAGRSIDEEHYGCLVPYLPAGIADPAPVLEGVAARRPGIDPRDVIVTEGMDALRARLEGFVDQGASKFVVIPILAPVDWAGELANLREMVAAPLEN
jgi:probable F420-dependent oxidoreductase